MVKQTPVQQRQILIKSKEDTVFVNGLQYQTTQQQIRQFFEACGQIKKVKIPRYQDTGRCIGYCHIIFQKTSSVKKALKLNKKQLRGRYLTIQIGKGQKQIKIRGKPPSDCKTIFVKNLPYDVTEDQVGDLFNTCGKIKQLRFGFNAVLKHFKGFCYIDFQYPSSVLKALQMNGKDFKGRQLVIDFDQKKAKKGYHNFPIKNTKYK